MKDKKLEELLKEVVGLYDSDLEKLSASEKRHARITFNAFRNCLGDGNLRAAEKTNDGWMVNPDVKKGILLGFKLGNNLPATYITDKNSKEGFEFRENFQFRDKDTYPLKNMNGVDARIVPGGSSIRSGAYIADGVIMMPPSYVNVGVYVDSGTMIDSCVNLGSCAQVGKKCHLSGGVQIGGVLEPIGASPVIIGDNVVIGLQSGIMEGTRVGDYAVIGAGVIIGRSTPVIDLERKLAYTSQGVHELTLVEVDSCKKTNYHLDGSSDTQQSTNVLRLYLVGDCKKEKDSSYGPEIPENAVVVPGYRLSSLGHLMAAPTIVKYRDNKTNASTALEVALR